MNSQIFKNPRCGRCAEPLPEDTASFCKFCGVPFFKVPPTTDFHLIAEEEYRRTLNRHHIISGVFAFLLLFAAVSVVYIVSRHHHIQQMAMLKKFPKIRFYYYDFPEFSSLSRNEKTEAAYIAIQAFQDHFGLKIDEYEILHDQIPRELSFLTTGYFADFSKFDFWDERVFNKNVISWVAQDRPTLDVLISNFPIYLGDSKKIESRHLNTEKLISGLGHPSLVIATSYRLLNELKPTSSQERARNLGEYVLAHELGHGLLGLQDYVVKQNPVYLRGPASVSDAASSPLEQSCLMHTDAGGGAIAWDHIRKRPLGTPVQCHAYEGLLSANHLREQAIDLAKRGKTTEAVQTMQQAIEQIKSQSDYSHSWVRARWEKELNQMRPIFW